jgi:hypothetical protein
LGHQGEITNPYPEVGIRVPSWWTIREFVISFVTSQGGNGAAAEKERPR